MIPIMDDRLFDKKTPTGRQSSLVTGYMERTLHVDQLRLFPSEVSNIEGTKFADGNSEDGQHYWLTPPSLMEELQTEFSFDFDPCPYPLPEGFNGLTCEWGQSNYVNPPFGSVIVNGKKKGPTAWARKAITENRKGKTVVMVYPIDRWILMLLEAGAEVRNLGNVKWCSTETGKEGNGTGRDVACFVLSI